MVTPSARPAFRFLPGDIIIERWGQRHSRWLFLSEESTNLDSIIYVWGLSLQSIKRQVIFTRDGETKWLTNSYGFFAMRDGKEYALW